MIEVWRHRSDAMPLPFEVEQELDEHLSAVDELLEKLGHRPFGELDLRMPGNSFDSQVIFRWRRKGSPTASAPHRPSSAEPRKGPS